MQNLYTCDSLVLGGSIAAVACAIKQSRLGKNVVLVHSGTCLYSEISDSADYRKPVIESGEWSNLLFPDSVFEDDNTLHPNRMKQHAENLLTANGVKVLYSMQCVSFNGNTAQIAFKSGINTVICKELFDLRAVPYISKDSYVLHYMTGGIHKMSVLSASNTRDDAQSIYNRYSDALKSLPIGSKLARGGMKAAQLSGVHVSEAIYHGLNCTPSAPFVSSDDVTAFYDVIVVGGGTAGASCAVFCARQGLKTLLLEMNSQLGGSATIGGVSTYWFGLRDGAARIIDVAVAEYRNALGLPAKPGLWNDDDGFYPDLKAHVLLKLCLESGVDVRFESTVCGCSVKSGRAESVTFASNGTLHSAGAKMIIDCTGDGDVCVLAGADYTYGNSTDGMTYWGSLAHYPSPDSYRNNFSTMVNLGDPLDYSRFIIQGRSLGENMYDHGSYVAVRESRHIHGVETVTFESLLSMELPESPLYSCFSNYDPKGRLTSEMCYCGMLPPNQLYVIPRGACIPVDKQGSVINGLLIGGKAISCTHDAFPGIRMQSDIERQGLALAALAACCIEQNADATKANYVKERILSIGGDYIMPKSAVNIPLSDVIENLTGDEAWDWLETKVTDCADSVAPVIRIMLAKSSEAVPLLTARFISCKSESLKLMLARLLLWHHSDVGSDIIISAINRSLSECTDKLPERRGSLNYGQMLPDHGLMPEPVYLINLLAYVPDVSITAVMSTVYDRLKIMHRDWHSLRAGIYCWCEAFAFTASRRNDRTLIPFILGILNLPEFSGESDDTLLNERLHMLRITLLHALHKLGEPCGTTGLQEYLNDRRATFRLAVKQLLAES